MKDMLSKKAVMLEPSGIRKFFDIVSEMPEAIISPYLCHFSQKHQFPHKQTSNVVFV